MTVEEKIRKFREDCLEFANKDSKSIEDKINEDLNTKVNEEITEYKNNSLRKYEKKIYKIEKDYNIELFNLMNEYKIYLSNKEKELRKNLKSELILKIKEFTDSNEYKEYLFKNIKQTIKKLEEEKQTLGKIYIIEKDFIRYGKEINEEFGVNIEEIENKYIGGSIGINTLENIYIDNTFKTSIEDEIDKINIFREI